jgi:hypothetical protein
MFLLDLDLLLHYCKASAPCRRSHELETEMVKTQCILKSEHTVPWPDSDANAMQFILILVV